MIDNFPEELGATDANPLSEKLFKVREGDDVKPFP